MNVFLFFRLVVRRANFLSGVNELIDAAMEVQDAFKKISLEQNSENGTANESEEEDPVHTMAKLKLGCLFEY